LFRQYGKFVASFFFRLGARQADLDDLVQEVFLTAHRLGGYRPGAASPTTFLARLALAARLSSRRRNVRWMAAQTGETALAVVSRGPEDPARALVLKRAAGRLQQALDAMEPAQRAVFILFELHGESCEAIAAGLGVRIGAVYSRLHAARKTFAKNVAEAALRIDSDDAGELHTQESP
jgi:RNA polymerase sigma-70 factor (ECF subfamily)